MDASQRGGHSQKKQSLPHREVFLCDQRSEGIPGAGDRFEILSCGSHRIVRNSDRKAKLNVSNIQWMLHQVDRIAGKRGSPVILAGGLTDKSGSLAPDHDFPPSDSIRFVVVAIDGLLHPAGADCRGNGSRFRLHDCVQPERGKVSCSGQQADFPGDRLERLWLSVDFQCQMRAHFPTLKRSVILLFGIAQRPVPVGIGPFHLLNRGQLGEIDDVNHPNLVRGDLQAAVAIDAEVPQRMRIPPPTAKGQKAEGKR